MQVLCTVISVLLHYFYLAAFFIMLAEGVDMLLRIVYPMHVRRKRETTLLLFAAWCRFLSLARRCCIMVGVSAFDCRARLRLKRKCYRLCVQRVMVYSSEIWPLRAEEMRRI